MPLGRTEYIVDPTGNYLPIMSSEDNLRGEVNDQNMYGC